jgi:hypothetical protein
MTIAAIPYGPDISTCWKESWLAESQRGLDNQVKTDAENARFLSVLAGGGCRLDESVAAASDQYLRSTGTSWALGPVLCRKALTSSSPVSMPGFQIHRRRCWYRAFLVPVPN